MKFDSLTAELDDGDLFAEFKSRKLKGPNAAAYSVKSWMAAAAAISNLTMRDVTLLHGALFLGHQFESLRSKMKADLQKLAVADSIDFVVASVNIQMITISSRVKAMLKKQLRSSGVGYLGDSGDIQIRNTGNQYLNPDNAVASLVDGMANLFYHIGDSSISPSESNRKIALRTAQKLVSYVSIEQGLKDFWNQAAWNGSVLRKLEGHDVFTTDNETLEKLWLAWQRRFETIVLQEGRLQAGEAVARDDRKRRPPVLKSTVIGLSHESGRKQEYIIGKARSGGDEQAMTLGAIEATYLSSFLDEVLPSFRNFDLLYRDIWRGWWVLQDIAKIHQTRMPSRGFVSWQQVDNCVLRFSASRVVKAIATALELPLTAAEIIVDLFTTNPDLTDPSNVSDLFQHGTWGRPIVRAKHEGRGRIVLAALMSPNPVMTMERWMTRTGMFDDPKGRKSKTVRGKIFERIARERLRVAGAKNRLLTNFHVSFLPTQGQGTEEIDLLLRFGSTIAVCELKCLNIPFEPLERYNHLGKIEEAVGQVKRKAKWCQEQPAPVLDALSVSDSDRNRLWRFIPIVILNSAYGAGITLNDCAVSDIDWMSTLIGSPDITTDGIFERGRGALMQSRRVYRDEADLERRLSEVAASPPSLSFEFGRIEWEIVPFPTQSGKPLLLRFPVSKGMPQIPPAM